MKKSTETTIKEIIVFETMMKELRNQKINPISSLEYILGHISTNGYFGVSGIKRAELIKRIEYLLSDKKGKAMFKLLEFNPFRPLKEKYESELAEEGLGLRWYISKESIKNDGSIYFISNDGLAKSIEDDILLFDSLTECEEYFIDHDFANKFSRYYINSDVFFVGGGTNKQSLIIKTPLQNNIRIVEEKIIEGWYSDTNMVDEDKDEKMNNYVAKWKVTIEDETIVFDVKVANYDNLCEAFIERDEDTGLIVDVEGLPMMTIRLNEKDEDNTDFVVKHVKEFQELFNSIALANKFDFMFDSSKI